MNANEDQLMDAPDSELEMESKGGKRKVQDTTTDTEEQRKSMRKDSLSRIERTAHRAGRFENCPDLDENWTIKDSEQLYHISGWGQPYFKVNDLGHIEVDPTGDSPDIHNIDLFELVEDVIERGYSPPLLIRFSDILQDRIRLLNEAFRRAIDENEYKNVYKGVFPIKVCQQARVVSEIVKYGAPFQFGLEAGSKPELLIVLAMLKTPGALIVCNGYKDSEYIETALLAQRLDQTPVIVIEKLHEVQLVIEAARKLDIKPIVGVRAKLSSRGTGRWSESTGDHAKFGLSATEIMEVVHQMRAANMMDSLQMLHFHIGSQISRISAVKEAIREAGQFFVNLHNLGANMTLMDVGGGLGVDYDGSKTSYSASMNYTVNEYASDVIYSIKSICDKHNVPHPIVVSESGRATVSHSTVHVFSVLAATRPNAALAAPSTKNAVRNRPNAHSEHTDTPSASPTTEAYAHSVRKPRKEPPEQPKPTDHQLIQNLYEVWSNIRPKNLQEMYHDACQYKQEALTLFSLGLLSLDDRARVENLFWRCCEDILPMTARLKYVPEELSELRKSMSFLYYVNMSVFQSAPDSWAIGQLFPIVPIHRLNEKPSCLGTIADITCDSDGKIDSFISSGQEDFKSLLELHQVDEDSPYYLGMFLSGAYQEVLGNLHNLFGDTNIVHVELDPENKKGYSVEHVCAGDTVNEVLEFMEYNPKSLYESVRMKAERAVNSKKLTLTQYKTFLRHWERSLGGYTYLWNQTD